MTLSDFRSTPHPNPDVWPGASPVCTGDVGAEGEDFSRLALSGSLMAAGIMRCMYFWDSPGSTSSHFRTAGIMLLDMKSTTEFYFRPLRPGAEPVLILIRTLGPTERFGDVAEMLHGSPGASSRTVVTESPPSEGNSTPNEVVEYHNGISRIRITRHSTDPRVFEMRHVLEPKGLEMGP